MLLQRFICIAARYTPQLLSGIMQKNIAHGGGNVKHTPDKFFTAAFLLYTWGNFAIDVHPKPLYSSTDERTNPTKDSRLL